MIYRMGMIYNRTGLLKHEQEHGARIDNVLAVMTYSKSAQVLDV